MNLESKFYYIINGIRNDPEDVNGCTDLAVSWIQNNTKSKADKFEYFTTAIFRRLRQNMRVESIRTVINRIPECNLILVGHSNGCDLIERYIRTSSRRIEALHLIAPAAEHDFNKNGYNKALRQNHIGKIHVHFSKNDKILKACSVYTPFLRYIGLGYGYMGFCGPKKVDKLVKDRVIEHEWDCNHTDYFKNGNFEKLMKIITQD